MAFSPCLFALWSSMVEVDKMIRYLHLKCTVFFVTLCPEKKKKTTPRAISWGIQGCISAESQQHV